ncbi:short chain dehydrogenase domain-containing protein [Ditylenchus destructor]|uniref:Short chain dehydrogenase domain-containing protein n=1 Tax=Ditylenchus destructor TaxID=166010 RepID=A0AAD4QT08_9BILA|nr:short chain dehydrogenase domain-containing protein [Ditylenchus destructor]
MPRGSVSSMMIVLVRCSEGIAMQETAGNELVVMVTGASGNLGNAVVRELLATSAKIVSVERNLVAQTSPPAGEGTSFLELGGIDLTDLSSCQEAVRQALDAFGRIDALVNTMNARTAYVISAAVLKPMQEVGYGRIVHIAAAPGLKAGANQAAYAASKGAVIRLTEAIAAENRDKRITANCILPGTIDTPQNRAAMPNAKTDGWVQPADIAKLIGFLISPAAGIVTGAAIPATGRV